MIKNGWHILHGYEVAVDAGKIVHAVKTDQNGGRVPAAVYRWSDKYRAWCQEMPISFSAAASGMRRGTIVVM